MIADVEHRQSHLDAPSDAQCDAYPDSGRGSDVPAGHQEEIPLEEYSDHTSDGYRAMVERIRIRLNLTTLQYQTLPDMVEALDMPKDRVCTYCWDGRG